MRSVYSTAMHNDRYYTNPVNKMINDQVFCYAYAQNSFTYARERRVLLCVQNVFGIGKMAKLHVCRVLHISDVNLYRCE